MTKDYTWRPALNAVEEEQKNITTLFTELFNKHLVLLHLWIVVLLLVHAFTCAGVKY